MAPKRAGKRESSAPAAKSAANAAKKAKTTASKAPEPEVPQVVDPREEQANVVSTGLDHAKSLPQATREMLQAILPFALRVLPCDRHAHQATAVDLIQKALKEAEDAFIEKVSATEGELEKANDVKAQRSSEESEAQAELTQKHEIVEEQVSKTLAASDELKEAEKALLDAQSHKKATQGEFEQLITSKEAFDKALASSKTLAEGDTEDSASIVSFVLPLCEKQGLDDSLCKAFPAAASKTKDTRGDFDTLVLTEVVKVLEEHVGNIGDKLSKQEPVMEECEENIQKATDTVSSAKGKKTALESELGSARQDEEKAKSIAAAAKAATADAEREIAARTAEVAKAQKELEGFRSGALAAFHALNDNGEASKMEEVAANDASASPQAMEEDLKGPQAEAAGSSFIKVPTPCRSVEEPAMVPASEA